MRKWQNYFVWVVRSSFITAGFNVELNQTFLNDQFFVYFEVFEIWQGMWDCRGKNKLFPSYAWAQRLVLQIPFLNHIGGLLKLKLDFIVLLFLNAFFVCQAYMTSSWDYTFHGGSEIWKMTTVWTKMIDIWIICPYVRVPLRMEILGSKRYEDLILKIAFFKVFFVGEFKVMNELWRELVQFKWFHCVFK